jgi:hypothetical protein
MADPLGSQPTLSCWENSPSERDPVRLNDVLLEQFVRLCGEQVRQLCEILLDIESTDDSTHGLQRLSSSVLCRNLQETLILAAFGFLGRKQK